MGVQKIKILINSISTWAWDDGSMQKITRALSRLGHEVTYLDRYISFAHALSNRKYQKLIFSRNTKIIGNISIIPSPIFPIIGFFFRFIRRHYEVRRYEKYKHINFDLIINYDPLGDEFIKLHDPKKSIYYITQDFTKITNRKMLNHLRTKSQDIILKYVSKVVVSNQNILANIKINQIPLIIDGGIEINMYSHKYHSFPKDTEKIKILYHGTFNEAIDYELLENMVCSCEEKYQLHLYGTIKDSNSKIKLLLKNRNVIYHGHIDHTMLAKKISDYDIGLIPYKINAFTQSVTSLKLLEYFAAGLPVISTKYSEALSYEKSIFYIWNDIDRLCGVVDEIRNTFDYEFSIANRRKVETKTWEKQCQKLISLK